MLRSFQNPRVENMIQFPQRIFLTGTSILWPYHEKEWAKIRNLETKLGNANKHQ